MPIVLPTLDGSLETAALGDVCTAVGAAVGILVGEAVGTLVGIAVGMLVGTAVGMFVGAIVAIVGTVGVGRILYSICISEERAEKIVASAVQLVGMYNVQPNGLDKTSLLPSIDPVLEQCLW